MKIGHYEPRVVKKGEEETSLNVPEGEVYWVIQIDKDAQFDVKNQVEAEIISRLVIQTEEIKLMKLILHKKEETERKILVDINQRINLINKRLDQHTGVGELCPHTGRK